ncbi:MAG: YdiU family protein [Microthrixaceae bacterium]|nr:YdiU family protein [Microthrixaceae bacterium]
MDFVADSVEAPATLVLNDDLAQRLGMDPVWLGSPQGTEVLVGNRVPEGAHPVAMAYAGHQFGNYSPRLGDGRAVLLGELLDGDSERRDLHLKGSGRTPFARGGDGKASIGPMLREYVVSEAMAALGIPTTRSLAVVSTGESVMRETPEPGAVLVRVAASHIRVGTFEYAVRLGGDELVRRLADYSIARHHPEAASATNPYLAFLGAVIEAQAGLVAQWMLVGFIHGVMNTDNMTISGEGIDYGPCAFMDRYDPATVFSSIDHGGRYAYGNQPAVAAWNLARLAETLLGLIATDPDEAIELATAELAEFQSRFQQHWSNGLARKLGLESPPSDGSLFEDLLSTMQADRLDWTGTFRELARTLRVEATDDDGSGEAPAAHSEAMRQWIGRWRAELEAQGRPVGSTAEGMDEVNPLYIPRNHLVDDALSDATGGTLAGFEELVRVLKDPYHRRDGCDGFTTPAPEGFEDTFRTFCGT